MLEHHARTRALTLLICCAVVFAGEAWAQGDRALPLSDRSVPHRETQKVRPLRTDSPRETLSSLLRLRRDLERAMQAYGEAQTRLNAERVKSLGPRFLQLIDLTAVPVATRQDVGVVTTMALLDIIGRVEVPPLAAVPDAGFFDDEASAQWRLPGTPLKIVRIDEGAREGEFLLSERTVELAPAFYARIQHLPLRSKLSIESWSETLPQLHGPLIPASLIAALPELFRRTWLDTPVWKLLATLGLSGLAVLLLLGWHRFVHRALRGRSALGVYRLLTPIAITLVVISLQHLFRLEVNVAGRFARIVDTLTTLLVYAGAAWIFWLIASISLDRLMREWDKGRDRLNADLVRLSVRALSVIGSIAILAYGTQAIGFPVLGLFAGLGVGGIAVALAVRPTLENLIGGLILLTDRPVRVGDFCTVGDHTGTVEAIGLRSTMIRGLDRTLISIPNASFADMQIVNWARCDRMLIRATIGLRYETEADHLRFVLAKLREMFQRHPRIEQDTVRVRFAGYGLSTLDVDIRVYALTRDWNDFYAIREDVFFRVSEIVRESGTGFALPSQRLYLGRDEGLEEDQIRTARDEVASWRRSGEFPFPDPPASRVAGLAATLDYPPDGSPDSLAPQREGSRRSEPLSAEPQPDVSEGDPQTRMPGRR